MTGIPLVWRKSSRSSGEGGNCVELALTTGAAFVRDSKNPDGPVLAWAPAALGALLGRVKDGRFDG
ncbi:hypothetical protein F4560_003861 [Saccharothrix ecbatanensis]|uniref:DUF397 domain-containing protein n=1 Tax=Saccharothrix ecbatanensis TaxID=1105145 RepID=A0A7W9HKP9_9PSEU|nr:DUF397 domain-containing protein [Saccharothrix ecbatanensis]MBB5804093.1 hypothetical protein [Saccharothrix ecbatanensis]